jgi:hypothetical protein
VTTRELPPDEWAKLAGTDSADIWPMLAPGQAKVLVVEDGEAVVGSWLLLPVWHAECLWIAPSHRGRAAVGRRLWVGLRRMLRDLGVGGFITGALSDEVRGLLAHVGARPLPGDHYVVSIKG